MNILVTAGNTQVLLDRVRCITNIFTGRTGTGIALHCHAAGHSVTLLTSHPEVVEQLRRSDEQLSEHWQVIPYRTFDDLHELLKAQLTQQAPDIFIHSAAVSDYRAAGIFAPTPGTIFDEEKLQWKAHHSSLPTFADRSAGKVKSSEPELWLRLVQTPKLIDLARKDWGYQGILVKFKLEVGITESQLLNIAETSRQQSNADLMVANTLEEAQEWAYLGPVSGRYHRIGRRNLAERLLEAIDTVAQEKQHG